VVATLIPSGLYFGGQWTPPSGTSSLPVIDPALDIAAAVNEGGFRQSGIGRELLWRLNNYLETKQVTRFRSDRPRGWYLGR
jgi:hypothetical protein